MTNGCTWCALVRSGSASLYECEAFSLVSPGGVECPSAPLTLVPRDHVAVLTDLPPAAMGTVLAGLTRIKAAVGPTEELQMTAHLDADSAHVHFHVTVRPLNLVGKHANPSPGQDRSRLIDAMVTVLRGWP